MRGKSRITYNGNRPAGNHPRPRLAHPNPARELADFLARGPSIGRIAPGHYFRGGQLLVRFLRTLRTVIRIVEIEQQQRGSRMRRIKNAGSAGRALAMAQRNSEGMWAEKSRKLGVEMTYKFRPLPVVSMRFLSKTEFLANHPQTLYLSGSREILERWLGRESNPRHEDFQSSALPTELPSLSGEPKNYGGLSLLTSGMVENLRSQQRSKETLHTRTLLRRPRKSSSTAMVRITFLQARR